MNDESEDEEEEDEEEEEDNHPVQEKNRKTSKASSVENLSDWFQTTIKHKFYQFKLTHLKFNKNLFVKNNLNSY